MDPTFFNNIYRKSERNSSILVLSGIIFYTASIVYAGWYTGWSAIIVILILPVSFGIYSLIYQPIFDNGKFFSKLINEIKFDRNEILIKTLSWKILWINVFVGRGYKLSLNDIIIEQIPLGRLKNKWWHKEMNYENVFNLSFEKKKMRIKLILIPEIINLEKDDLNRILNASKYTSKD